MADDFKYHIDHHVGLLVPAELATARAAAARGELDAAGLRAVEDAAVIEAVRRQRRIPLSAVGDGELRRAHPLSVLFDAVEGFVPPIGTVQVGYSGPDGPEPWVRTLLGPALVPQWRRIDGKPVEDRRLAAHEAEFLAGVTAHSLVVSLPSPGFAAELCASEPSAAEVGGQLAGIVAAEIVRLAADGVRHVTLHSPLYPFLLTVEGRAAVSDPDAVLDRLLAADGAVLDAVGAAADVPAEFRLSLDITTSGTAPLGGGYDRAAVSRFLAGQDYGRLCVEYPEAEAARFPLDLVGPGRTVSLGVVDVRAAEVEPVDAVVGRIDEAVAVLDIADVAIATNGRFLPGPVTEAVQWQKLQLVEMVARYFWGNEL